MIEVPRPSANAARLFAAGAAAVVLAGVAVHAATDHGPGPATAWAGAGAAIGLLALLPVAATRWTAPLAAAVTAAVAVAGTGTSSCVAWFAVCVLTSWCALAAPLRDALLYVGAALLLFVAEGLLTEPDPGWLAWIGGTAFALLATLGQRRERALVAELRAAQAELADRARVEERTRIARELHDVIAHSLTVSLLHVASARMAVRYDPADAERALAEAERLGRETLDEVRATVGLMRRDERPGPDGPSLAPLPGLADLPALAERFRSAGAPVELTVDGDPAGVPAATGLAVYRIVQEALTNAAKHAPGAPVTAAVRLGREVEVVVDSAAPPARGTAGATGAGMGLPGMAERAGSLGGTFAAGPGGSGWRVRAVLPLPSARTTEGAR